MIGRNYIEIGSKEFLDGIASSPHTDDGGFSPETVACNVTSTTSKLGVLYQSMTPLGISTNLSGNVIASTFDSSSTNNTRYVVTDSGKYFTLDSSLLFTLKQTDAANTYSFGTTDMVNFRGEIFCSSQGDIAKLSSNLGTIDATWWSVTRGHGPLDTTARHPMVVYNSNLYIADGYRIHRWDGTTSSTGVLTYLSNFYINAMGIDPSTGKILIGISAGQNASNTLPRQNMASIYDGVSLSPVKTFDVEGMITAFWPVGSTNFVAYGTNLGYWNGAGVSFLRKLNVSSDLNSLVYKHKMCSDDKTLFIAEGENILAYEEIKGSVKRFYYVQTQSDTLNGYIQTVFNLGQGRMAYSYTDSVGVPKFKWWNKSFNTNQGVLTFFSKKYKLARPIFIREIFIEFVDGIPDDVNAGTITILDQAGNSYSFSSLSNDSGETRYEWTCNGANGKKFRNVQLKYVNNSNIIAGVSRFIIYYDVAE